MKIPFGFGNTEITLDIPEHNLMGVLRSNPIPENGTTEEDILSEALANPIQSHLLREIVKPGEKIVIVTSDVTRPMPSQKVLPFVIAELAAADIPDADITIVFALGSHRAHTEEEKIKLVGETILRRFRCLDSVDDFVRLGITENGTPVDIFRPVAEADRRICLGNIEYHYFAGYSGGAKAIMPGVSTREAIQANHRRMTEPEAATGRIAGNPVREDIENAMAFVPIDFIVNVVLDEHKRIRACVAGHFQAAHRKGCAILDDLYGIQISKKAGIVIVSSGGYPKDINLYQAQKALDNAGHAVRDGGTILWLASAKEGLGEKHFETWMLTHDHPSDMIEHIQREFILGGHKAAAIAMIMEKADIVLVSDLEPEFVRKIHLQPASDAQSALDELIKHYGTDAQVLAMPFGGSTLPILRQ